MARLIRRPLESALSASAALLALREDERPVALVGAWAGGGAIVASEPVRLARQEEDPLALLDQLPAVGDGEAVGGGWLGFLGYRVGERVERLPPAPPQPVPVPPFSLAYYDHVLRRDGDARWWFEALWDDAHAERLERRFARLAERMAGPPPTPRPHRCGPFAIRPSMAGHHAAVKRCMDRIAAGDLYQANLTVRLEASFDGDAIDLFAACAEKLEPMYGAYVGDPRHQVVSLSPELFLERRGRAVRTAPIKGTVARDGPSGDAGALTRSGKDRAENVMIVDLMRNDLGRVCAYGSVSVPALARAEAHPGVWHLVSDVEGTLLDQVGDGDLLRATFPPGSVTGAPKIKAMEVVAQLESTAREAYTGAAGYVSPCRGLELNVAIRTFEVAGGRVWLGAGGGVTSGSTPEGEYEECLVKARPLVAAAGAQLAPVGDPPASADPPRPSRLPRPDPGRGIFETLLVLDRQAQEAATHCARLAASAATVYGRHVDAGGLVENAAAAAGDGPHRLRIAMLGGGEPRATLAPVDPAAICPHHPVALQPLAVPGGLGPHKWLDRRLLDAVDGEALIVELDGEVLETGRGNVFLVESGTLLTPPADGRILPGVTRAALIACARAAGIPFREERLGLERLRAADEILVTSSIRILQPAGAAAGPVGRLLQQALGR